MNAKFLLICAAALCLTACTTSAYEETIASPVTTITTETPITIADNKVISETAVSLYEFDKYTEENCTYVEITDETPFYSCKYEQTGLVDGVNFTDTALFEQAETALLSSQVYAELYDYIKQCVTDNEPALDVTCESVLAYDLDSNDTDEYAFLFRYAPSSACTDETMLESIWGAISPNIPYSLVLCDSNNKFYVSDIRYASNAELYILNYGKFAQFVVSGGVSNNSSCADYFSYYDGEFELELREFRAYEIQDEGFLLHTMAQASNAWLIFWNDDIKGYVTPEAVQISHEERDEIFEQLPLTDEEREQYEQYNICIIGGKYYSLYGEYLHSVTFVKEDGEFVPVKFLEHFGLNERKMPIDREFEIPYAVNFDYDSALEKAEQ